jgi:Uma2 family endonuclease
MSAGISREEYLARERASTTTRSEWIDGQLREMTGSNHAHCVIVAHIGTALWVQLEGRPFTACLNAMKVRVPDGPYYYPNVAVVPHPPEFEDREEDVVLDPLVVVEVLAPATEDFDRGEKLDNYRRIPSLTDYLLVDQGRCRIDHFTRLADNRSELAIHRGPAAVVRLHSVGCELVLRDVYDGVLERGA